MHDIGAIARKRVVDGARSAASSSTSAAASARCRTRRSSRRVRAGRGAAAARPGDRARLRAPRREEEPRPRAHQVPGRQARHRGVPPAGRGGAARSCRTTSAGPRTWRTCTRIARRRSRPASRWPRGTATDGRRLRRVARDQRLRAAPGRLRRRDGRRCRSATSRRAQTRALADIARRYVGDTVRTTVEQNIVLRWVSEADLPALYRDLAAIGPRRRRAPARSSTSPRAPAPTPASSASSSSRGLAGELRTRLARAALRARRGGARPAHQGQRLLQLLRPAPRRRHRLLRHQPQDRRHARCRTSRWCSAASGRRTPASYGLAIGAVPSKRDPGGRRPRSPTRYVARAERRRDLPGLHRPHRQERARRELIDEFMQGAALRGGPRALLRLGRPARVHDGRHRRRRVRGRGRLPHRHRAAGGRARRLRGPAGARGRAT